MRSKSIVLLFTIILIMSCNASKTTNKNRVGLKVKTSNANTPYIYKYGYGDFTIQPILVNQSTDSTYVNELRFNAVYSSFYTKQLLFEKYGRWDKEIWIEGNNHPILIWKNRQLLKPSATLYTVAANGSESKQGIFATILVFDSKDQDALADDSLVKQQFVTFFCEGMKKLNKSSSFYKLYWEMVNEHNISKPLKRVSSN